MHTKVDMKHGTEAEEVLKKNIYILDTDKSVKISNFKLRIFEWIFLNSIIE